MTEYFAIGQDLDTGRPAPTMELVQSRETLAAVFMAALAHDRTGTKTHRVQHGLRIQDGQSIYSLRQEPKVASDKKMILDHMLGVTELRSLALYNWLLYRDEKEIKDLIAEIFQGETKPIEIQGALHESDRGTRRLVYNEGVQRALLNKFSNSRIKELVGEGGLDGVLIGVSKMLSRSNIEAAIPDGFDAVVFPDDRDLYFEEGDLSTPVFYDIPVPGLIRTAFVREHGEKVQCDFGLTAHITTLPVPAPTA